jgi:hypothetical protein
MPLDASPSDAANNESSVSRPAEKKMRKGKGRASGVTRESGNDLLSELNSVLPQAITSNTLASEVETRRSVRAAVPSKHSEQMNQIGSRNLPLPPVEKENIPPSLLPTWAIAAKNYLLGTDLGAEWTECVQRWIKVEETLGYGTVGGSKACTLLNVSFSNF